VIVATGSGTRAASKRYAVLTRDALERAGFARSNYVGGGSGLDERGDLGTLNWSRIPAVMVELGNMRDPEDAVRMTSPDGQRDYATALAAATRRFLEREATCRRLALSDEANHRDTGTMTSTATARTRRPRRELDRLGPVEQLRAGRLGRRLPQLLAGLVLYGVTLAMIIRGTLGNAPWDVLHQGLARHLPISIGTAVILVSLLVLVLWIPLRELPGLGTIANSFLVGLSADAALAVIAPTDELPVRVLLTVGGVLLNAVATAMYIGSQFGPGPRDGLMTGLHRRTGLPIGLVRTALEAAVVAVGWLLGGVVGLGTVLYALAIGPLVQWLLPLFVVELPGVRDPGA
jgi:uncharacterized membrane protein YczE